MLAERRKRVAELLRQEIALILHHELKDPRLGFLTVSEVKLSRDLRFARVFVSFLEEDQHKIKETMEILEHARGFIKRLLGERVVLKFMPELKFEHDTSARQAIHIENLIKRLKENGDL